MKYVKFNVLMQLPVGFNSRELCSIYLGHQNK